MNESNNLDEENLVDLQLLIRNTRTRETRKERGLTQKELSLITGIPTATISQIENLRLVPGREMMEEIALALDKSVDYLFPKELSEAVEAGVFNERKAQLSGQDISTLTERKHLRELFAFNAIDGVEKAMDRALLKKKIGDVLDSLPLVGKSALVLRFGLDGAGVRTLEETTKKLRSIGLTTFTTSQRASQIEAEALRKLRHPSRSRELKEFLV